jgi:peptidoglycan/xylan/chitin deacetylase (PgdA/CDA1 family)
MFFDRDSGGYLVFLIAIFQTICLGLYVCFLQEGLAQAAPGEYSLPIENMEGMERSPFTLENSPVDGEVVLSSDGTTGDSVEEVCPLPEEEHKPDYLPVRSCPAGANLVSLTFDDGPSGEWTFKYLEVLEKHEARATFFVVGERVIRYPEQVRAVASSGHELGAHSLFHQRLAKFTSLEMLRDLRATRAVIEAVAQVEVSLFRPPYGEYNQELLERAGSLRQHTILWNIDPRDWTSPSPEDLVKHVVSTGEDGAIIILHEGKKNTLKALPGIIRGFRERGFELVTVSELLAARAGDGEIGEIGEDTD